MSANFLTMQSTMSCPHGGNVVPTTSNSRVKADGAFVLRSNDLCTIAGCPYTIGSTPHPCVRVQWDVHCERHTSDHNLSLNEDSVGLCLAADGATQGTVVIQSTQRRGKGS
jgi:hypothetical protein